MPEIKHNFTGGKMNKDLDERLVPKGEYRDAMNIQVSTSEGSDVGTVQNILGNSIVVKNLNIDSNSICVGAVSDEKNDALYWFVREPETISEPRDIIFELKNNYVKRVFVDYKVESGGVLKFPKNIITGINIIDDMLFWTDGINEPKKINIPRSIEGTYPNGNFHTKLINADQGINFGSNILIEEEHVTVVKKAPIKAPELDMLAGRPGNSYTDLDPFSFTGVESGDVIVLNAISTVNYQAGDILLIKFNDFQVNISPITVGEVRVVVESVNVNELTCSVLAINNIISAGDQNYSCDLDRSYEKLYKLKFPRFAIRYKYQDGEYSSFGPFSEVAFVPGPWDESTEKVSYLPNTGYNLGMENKLRELTLKNIVPADLPKDVKQIDIIYKESNSPAVYVVDEIKQNDTYWTSNSYLIQQENIKSILPSNQLLRPYDNVPKTALAQEISGNRIIYGNYSQNYSIGDLRANFNLSIRERELVSRKSIKSIRDYQVGIVYTDKYNRQTPVLTDTTGALSVSKFESSKSTQIEVTPNHSPPSWATHHKFYIKETSTEYYNLSLDRHFDAEDGNIWLSFASNDRDKLDLENTLYLKKKYNSNEADVSLEKYKIIDIKNEAPEYIKTRRSTIGRAYNNTNHPLSVSSEQVFTTFQINPPNPPTSIEQGGMPVPGQKQVRVNATALTNTVLNDFHKRQNSPSDDGEGGGPLANNALFMRIGFNSKDNEEDQPYRTEWYEIDNVSKTSNDFYLIELKEEIKDEASWVLQSGTSGFLGSDLISTTEDGVEGSLFLEIGQDIVQNKSVFQGRFFVKILKDQYINESLGFDQAYDNAQVIATANCGYLKDFTQEDVIGTSGVWGHTKAAYEAEIIYFNNNGPRRPAFPYGDPLPPSAVPTDSYWGHSVWQRISSILDAKGSRWVIDEAFAVGEEPLWGYNSNNTSADTDFFISNISYGSPQGKSKIYGGYNLDGINDGTPPNYASQTTIDHNEGAINSTIPSLQNIPTVKGLGHNDPADFEHYSVGKGVEEFTIDISYIGPGRKAIGNITDAYGDTTPDSGWVNSNSPQFMVDWNNFYTISNRDTSFSSGIGDDATAREAQVFVNNLTPGAIIRFTNDPNRVLYRLTKVQEFYKSNYAESIGYTEYPFVDEDVQQLMYQPLDPSTGQNWKNYYNTAYFNRRITFRLTLECIVSPGSPIGTDGVGGIGFDPLIEPDSGNNVLAAGTVNTCPIEILSLDYFGDEDVPFPENPAIFETEPKDSVDLNIFHEATDTIPLAFSENDFAPIGSKAKNASDNFISVTQWGTGANANVVQFDSVHGYVPADVGSFIRFLRPDGSYTSLKLVSVAGFTTLKMDISSVENNPIGLGWNNCYSFGNGVESNRIRDTFNSPVIDKGPKVSATLDTVYEEELRKYGLIYSGIYNSTSGINNLNQFIQAEKITKDINPIYGSIQKLYSGWGQGGDLVALCEDRVLKILANKDALYNADGDTNVTSTNNVLGQTIPYSGEYGISKNPESFASEAYRAYFTDKVRGTVMRLSIDGLTPISSAGMKDWFRDHLRLGDRLVGSYDDRKDEYNITIKGNTISKTVTFKEDVKGWVSFKSFIPENAISCANEYYTFKDGGIWKHHKESADRNTFYGEDLVPSTLEVIFNEVPGSVKSFKTVNYEGSQAKVTSKDEYGVTLMDGEYFNLSDVEGWHVTNVITNLEQGGITEFIEKEGKWFGYVIGNDVVISEVGNTSGNYDTEDSSIQGIGRTASAYASIIYGCMDATQFNYNDAATNDDGSCVDFNHGCTDVNASNYLPSANTDDGTCYYLGCTTGPLAIWSQESAGGSLNYDPNATVDDGSCVTAVWGCTVLGSWNYNSLADFGSAILSDGTSCGYADCMCIPFNPGCTDSSADNYIAPSNELTDVNTDDGSCVYNGCTDPLAQNYTFTGSSPVVDGPNGNLTYLNGNAFDDGSCTYVGGCTDAAACNYDATMTQDDGSCYSCADNNAVNYNAVMPFIDYTCNAGCTYCEDVAVTIDSQATATPGMNNGTITIEWPQSASATSYTVYGSGITTATFTPSGNTIETYTITGLGTGTYNIYVTTNCTNSAGVAFTAGLQLPGGNIGTVPNFGTLVTATITSTPPPGCTDNTGTNTTLGAAGMTPINGQTWGACNYDSTAAVDDGSCDYTSCAGCTDPLYVEYDAVFIQPSPTVAIAAGYCTTLIAYGCTNPTAFNYDSSANTDDGSCVPVVNGCMDNTLNNDGTYAASNYSGPPVGSANTDDGSCNSYNCPDGLNSTISSSGSDFVFKILNWQTPYVFGSNTDIVKEATIGGAVVTSFASNSNIFQGPNNVGKRFFEPIASYFTAGDTSITVDFNVTTTDGNCDVNATTKIFTIGCTDANADVSGSFDIADNTQCTYSGCTDANACNFDFNADATHTDDGSCYSCGDPAAYNYDGNGIVNASCNANCTYAGCMDATPQADGSGFAASNYAGPGSGASPEASIPCNDTDPAQVGTGTFDASQDNGCCNYNANASIILGDPNATTSSSFAANTYFEVFYGIGSTGYTEGTTPSITLGVSGGTQATVTGQPQNNMNFSSASRLAHTIVPGSGGGNFSGSTSEWHNYVDNGSLLVTVTNATFNGSCSNPSLTPPNELPQSVVSNSRSYTVGCRNDSTAANYNANLDLHLDGSCIAANPGCTDPTATNYDAAFNQDCSGTNSGSDYGCCCYTCSAPTWQSSAVSNISWDSATSPTFAIQFNLNWNAVSTASTYTLTHNGSGSFTSLTVTPTITNGLATYTFTNTSSTHFQHGTTYTFKLEANCVSTNGDSCGVSSEEITSHEFVVI